MLIDDVQVVLFFFLYILMVLELSFCIEIPQKSLNVVYLEITL